MCPVVLVLVWINTLTFSYWIALIVVALIRQIAVVDMYTLYLSQHALFYFDYLFLYCCKDKLETDDILADYDIESTITNDPDP